jgi:hypothetical protein
MTVAKSFTIALSTISMPGETPNNEWIRVQALDVNNNVADQVDIVLTDPPQSFVSGVFNLDPGSYTRRAVGWSHSGEVGTPVYAPFTVLADVMRTVPTP